MAELRSCGDCLSGGVARARDCAGCRTGAAVVGVLVTLVVTFTRSGAEDGERVAGLFTPWRDIPRRIGLAMLAGLVIAVFWLVTQRRNR